MKQVEMPASKPLKSAAEVENERRRLLIAREVRQEFSSSFPVPKDDPRWKTAKQLEKEKLAAFRAAR